MTRRGAASRGRARRPPLAVVGAGHAGGSLAVLLAERGWPVQALWSRRRSRARTVARRVQAVSRGAVRCPSRPEAAAAACDLLLLAVPDAALSAVANRLARPGTKLSARVALHLSGAQGLEALAPLATRGIHTGSCHPLAVLPEDRPPHGLLNGAGFAVDGDRPARAMARRLARALGGVPFVVTDRARAAYHLAAALVANDSVALFELAMRQFRQAGIAETTARRSLAHLLQGTAATLGRWGVEKALTGPAVRGDVDTLLAHLQAAGGPGTGTAAVHHWLSGILLDIAIRSGRLDRRRARLMLKRLAGDAAPRRGRRRGAGSGSRRGG